MKEYVGNCIVCQKPVYCLDGFLNGVNTNKGVCCFDCERKSKSS